MLPLIEEHFAAPASPAREDINAAFWQACHGGQLEVAVYPFERSADLNWLPPWAKNDRSTLRNIRATKI
jgi:hypothetical protein